MNLPLPDPRLPIPDSRSPTPDPQLPIPAFPLPDSRSSPSVLFKSLNLPFQPFQQKGACAEQVGLDGAKR